MSLWADQEIKNLRKEVDQLRKEVDELKSVPRGTSDALMSAFNSKFGKVFGPETPAKRLK